MYRFADQIEVRVDRRHILFFVIGGVVWTLIAFFFGMIASGSGKQRPVERGLAALGWLDKEAQSLQSSRITFSKPPTAPRRTQLAHNTPTPHSPPAHKQKRRRDRHSQRRNNDVIEPVRRHKIVKKRPTRRKKPKRRTKPKRNAHRIALQRALQPSDNRDSKTSQNLSNLLLGKHKRKTQRVRPPKPRKGKKKYTISLRLPKNRRKVMRLYKRLQQLGHQPLLLKVSTIYGKRFRMTLGRFSTRREAYSFARKIRRQVKVSSVLRHLR
ncbi:MAG TPA: hypothetical protein DCE42_27840 [Myxococcales bacterium]|nr:hypothetical protein [Deltaproteobacteria bacterium]HAA58606.1 hypothetical protein [Myxococcales bacterium]|tara:strand:+ start:672 stop:1475 length:804 start_codon:yes stop_codon:yes gene_type:complete